jgi:signal transduction histidine kinase
MRRWLLVTYLALAVAVLAALEIPLGITYGRTQRADLENRVKLDALTLATLAEDGLERGSRAAPPSLARVARTYAAGPGGRVVVVDRRGTSILDTSTPAGRGFATRPEIAAALSGASASGTRHSDTLGADLLYVAVPVASSGAVHGAVRVTYPMSALTDRVQRYWLLLAAIAGIVLAAAAVVGARLSRTVTGPLAALEVAAEAVGDGDLEARAPTDGGPPEIKALASRFNETVERLDAAIRSQEDFVADASHQLRTPLAALRLRLENLEHGASDVERTQLERSLAEVERLNRIVDGLLALARADSTEAKPVPVDLPTLVSERLRAWDPEAARSGVRLVSAMASELHALATPSSLDQVLDNVLANALAVSPSGSRISVEGRPDAEFAELHVVDEGPGMTEAERSRAFDRFWRAGSHEGTGLGLAIARRLVAADGGELRLRKASSGGVDVVIRLRAA